MASWEIHALFMEVSSWDIIELNGETNRNADL